MGHLEPVNCLRAPGGGARKQETTEICYVLDIGACDWIDVCGLDLGDCGVAHDVCMLDQ